MSCVDESVFPQRFLDNACVGSIVDFFDYLDVEKKQEFQSCKFFPINRCYDSLADVKGVFTTWDSQVDSRGVCLEPGEPMCSGNAGSCDSDAEAATFSFRPLQEDRSIG